MPKADEVVAFLEKHKLVERGKSPWPSYNPREFERYRVDWDTLFPSPQRAIRDGDADWDMYGDDWTIEFGADFEQSLEEALSNGPPEEAEIGEMAESNEWDVCAWYQPMHYFGPDWGIYIRQDCLLSQAVRIARLLRRPAHLSRGLARALIRASVYAYFLHEQYHHKVESLAIRLEVVEQGRVYVPYVQRVYSPAIGTDHQLEEALANASCYRRLLDDPYRRWMSPPIVGATRSYLLATFGHEPPGYRMATKCLTDSPFQGAESLLHARVHEASLQPQQAASDWAIATRLIQSLFKVTDNIWLLVTPGGSAILPTQPWP